jgi:hypothetical protein
MSFAELEEVFRRRLKEEGMSHILCVEMELAMRNQSAQDFAELHAYATCGCCNRVYDESDFSRLPAARGGLWHKDEWELQEYRQCMTPMRNGKPCDNTLVVVREYYRLPEPRYRFWRFAMSDHFCDGCLHRFRGHYVHQEPPQMSNWKLLKSYPRTLCAECAGGRP